MTKADEIADAVTAAIDQQRRRRYTFTRKLLAGVGATVLLLPAVHEAFVWLL